MATINEMLARLKNLKSQVPKLAEESFNDNAEYAEDLNRQQLNQGVRSDGSILPDYSDKSIKKFGKRRGAIRLFDSGDFWGGIKFKAKDGIIDSTSADSKTDMLKQKYQPEIIGLTAQSKEEMKPYVIKSLRQKSNKILFNE